MLFIEYVIATVVAVVAWGIGMFVGMKIGKVTSTSHLKNMDFIAKYYQWFSALADKKIPVDRLRAKLVDKGSKAQINKLESYYLKEKKRNVKQLTKQLVEEIRLKEDLHYLRNPQHLK